MSHATAIDHSHPPTGRARYDVLVVEDNRALCDELAFALADEGLNVATAFNGRDALDVLQTAEVGLVVLDLMMPVMSGRELAETMQGSADWAQIPIVFVTAVSNVHHAPPGPVYLKPIRRESFVRAVRLHLARAALVRESA